MCKKGARAEVHGLSAREDSGDLELQWIVGTLAKSSVVCPLEKNTFDGKGGKK